MIIKKEQMKKNTTGKNSGNNLERKLGLFPVTNIVIANMIGAGIFTTSGLLMTDLKNPLLMMGLWIAGGVIALCGALSYGELSAAIPRAGGEYIFLSRLYHPVLGFLSGWVSFFVGFSAPIAASAIGFSEYFTRAFPSLLHPGILPGSIESVVLKKSYAILVIILFTAIHIRGIVFGARVQNFLTLLKVGLMLGLVMFGFLLGTGNFNHLFQGSPFTLDFGGLKTIALSLMWIMFAYSGWNASAYIGSEVKDPQKNLPRSLILGTGAVILVYFFINLFYLYAIPPAKMNGIISIAGLAAGNSFGNTIENFISILVGFALFSSLSAFVILGPRVYYSMAVDGHFFKFAAEVHPRFGVPAKSILLQGIFAAVMVFFGTFDQVLTYMGFSLGIFPILTVAGLFKMRRQDNIPYKSPGFPFVQLVFMLFGVSILLLSFFERPTESSIALGTVAIGIPVYWIFRKRVPPQPIKDKKN